MTILWDWNGTLVADVAHVVNMNNLVLEQFGYRHTSEEEYRAKFRHPVHEYYYDLGVTAEDFPKIAKVWNKAYVDGFDCVPLAPGAAEAVRRFKEADGDVLLNQRHQSQQDQRKSQAEPQIHRIPQDLPGASFRKRERSHADTSFTMETKAVSRSATPAFFINSSAVPTTRRRPSFIIPMRSERASASSI